MSLLNLDVIDERLRRRPREVDFGRRLIDEFGGKAVAVAHVSKSIEPEWIMKYRTFSERL